MIVNPKKVVFGIGLNKKVTTKKKPPEGGPFFRVDNLGGVTCGAFVGAENYAQRIVKVF
jgi:hypothetical protein